MCTFNEKLLFYFIFAYCFIESTTITSTTLNIKQRVAILKKQLNNEIRAKLGDKLLPIEESSFEFIDHDNDGLLTPVTMAGKKKLKTKVTAAVTTPAKSTTANQANVTTPRSQKRNRSKGKKKQRMVKVASEKKSEKKDIFYRRLLDESAMNTEVQWAHCQDMITPYLNGAKTDLTHPKHYSTKHPVVSRFIQLLNENTTTYTKEDIYSILYQISNLNLRLFQWDVPALNLLFNILISEGRHTFLNLKRGIRAHFEEWRLDISNVTNLLRQTRIFRPPCVRISDSTGSTKSKQASKYPKKTLPTTTCESEEDLECKYRKYRQ